MHPNAANYFLPRRIRRCAKGKADMKSSVKLAFSLFVGLFAVIELAHFASAQTTTLNAYVYVINRLNGPINELDGFSADSTGALTALPGSPFWTSITASQFWTLAHTPNWLFLSDEVKIYSFSIASNGALTLKSSINAQQFSPAGSDVISALSLDRSGLTLYAAATEQSAATGNAILAFHKGSNGVFTYLGSTDYPDRNGFSDIFGDASSRLDFISNNQYAYNAGCDNGNASWFAAQRNFSDGTLGRFPINPTIPSNPNGNYCPIASAVDPTNHLAVGLFLEQSGPAQLAVYTADSSGNLTTTSTAQNMPTTAVGDGVMSISPAGNLLAIASGRGLQVFHFNGSNPITPYTKQLAVACNDLAWDKHNHLYIIGSKGVRAWRITPNFWKAASPYPLNGAALTVLSK